MERFGCGKIVAAASRYRAEAKRNGRGEKAGRVLIQSYHPDHYALEYAREQNYEKFYEYEINFRRNLSYPPFVALINVMVKHSEYARAASLATDLANSIKAADPKRALRILGPAPAPIARLRERFRFRVLLRAKSRSSLRAVIAALTPTLQELDRKVRAAVDVDPVAML